ncbi:MAG: hypothetical protein JST93_33860 [Acidobacteria bacterium]|nr:hypothetical protein [Acidobacteriota bacterium]
MKIQFDSELMANQTHAVVMGPDVAFEVLQSQDGDALFFSVGTDNVFYLTREVAATSSGWTKVDLSSGLESQFNGAAVTAKTFRVAQNGQTQAIDLGLVVTVAGVDYLFLSLGNANTDAAWANGVTWTLIPFDAGTAPSPLTVTALYMMNIPGANGVVENIFVDILSSPGNTLNPINRYYITAGGSPQWNEHLLPVELSAGSITSCLANRPGDPIPGIYTYGTIGTAVELVFVPQFNWFMPKLPANPVELTLPAGTTAIASAVNSAGVTNLFVSGSAGLSVFVPGNQGQGATPVVVVTDALAMGASQLAASTNGGQTAVWGVNAQGGLFYVQCAEGSEGDATAWSAPVPLLPSVEGFAFYLNLNAGSNVLFANLDGQNLVALSQDPVTANWLQRSILLPGTATDDMAEYESFTTHIQVTDDNGVPAPGTAATLTATSRVSVYVNSVYYVLQPSEPLQIAADATGVLTVVQEAQTLSAMCLQVALPGTPEVTASINPMSNALATLGTVTDGTSLANVTVTNSDGTQQPLVPAGTSSGDLDAAAQSIVQFHQIAAGLPQDGSRQAPVSGSTAGTAFAVSFASGGVQYQEGAVLTSGNPIVVAAEDFFQWIKHAFEEIEHVIVQAVDGVYHFIATIAGQIYDVLLDCLSSVAHAVEFVFNKIKVFFKDLVKWLGFLFNWSDILNTHSAMKNILKQCVVRALGMIPTLATDVQNAFQNLENELNNWAQLPAVTNTVGDYQSSSSSSSSSSCGSPQSNWAVHHTKGNASQATTSYTTPNPDRSPWQNIFADLEQLVDGEIGDIKTAITQLKTDVIDPIATLTPVQVIEKTVAIVLDFLLSTAEQLLVTGLEIIAAVVDGIVALLDAPLHIPILSPIYKSITKGSELSILDLTCLVGAIPATIVYKIVKGQAPFTAEQAQTLANAADFNALQTILSGSNELKAARPSGTGTVGAVDSLADIVTLLADVFATFGALVTVVMAVAKKGESEGNQPPSKALRYISACAYFPYVAPDLVGVFTGGGVWYMAMNDIVTVLAVAKTMTDNSDTLNTDTEENSEVNQAWRTYISPVAECIINAVWLAPAIGMVAKKGDQASDWVGFAANLCFDIGGIAAPAAESKIVGEEVADIVFVAIQILTGAYGLLSAGAGIALATQSSAAAA